MGDERDWIEGLLEQRDAMNAEATAAPRDAEIARLRQQLAAAQADNAALREVVAGLLAEFDAAIRHAEWSAGGSTGMSVPFHGDFAAAVRFPSLMGRLRWWAERMRPALATPAPGAPWIAAVRGLVEAATDLRGSPQHERECHWVGCGEGCAVHTMTLRLDTALAAVRAVLSPPQDTAGISCQRDTE